MADTFFHQKIFHLRIWKEYKKIYLLFSRMTDPLVKESFPMKWMEFVNPAHQSVWKYFRTSALGAAATAKLLLPVSTNTFNWNETDNLIIVHHHQLQP